MEGRVQGQRRFAGAGKDGRRSGRRGVSGKRGWGVVDGNGGQRGGDGGEGRGN